MTGFYTVQVLPEAFPNDFRKIWNVRVFTHHPEEVKRAPFACPCQTPRRLKVLRAFRRF